MDYEKLLKTGDKCINDEPAACVASCPLHVDVRTFADEMQKGNFKIAYKVLEKRMPFARIIGMICDHPCEVACVRNQVDEAVQIHELERAAVELGYEKPKKVTSIPKKNLRIAIVGGGIKGLVAAEQLDKKGFYITVYEASSRLGSRLWDYEEISDETLEEEIKSLLTNINVNFNHYVDSDRLNDLLDTYDAVFVSVKLKDNNIQTDSRTLQARDSSLFYAGEEKEEHEKNSVINAVSIGKKAAVSIERYIKKFSMTASREREGPYETPLNYNLEDAVFTNKIKASGDRYNAQEAVKEAQRCMKCRCIQCIKTCSHMRRFNIDPIRYVRQINHNENVILGTRYANKMINSCTKCGLCGERCHLDINMGEIIQETRESMVERKKMPPSAHDFALKDMKFSNSDKFFTVKKHNADTSSSEYIFYPGCQLSAYYPEYVEKTYEYLLSFNKNNVGIMLGCCGAPADWAGRKNLMIESADKIRSAWEEAGRPVFILACSSCMNIFDKYINEIKYISLWEVFEKYGVPENRQNKEKHVLNIHDACSTRHNKNVQGSIRNIVSSLGYDIEELIYSGEKTKCCGYGGLVYYANKDQAEDFVKDRIKECDRDILVYCAMCKNLLVDGGKKTYHMLDLIFGENMEELALKKMPNISQRHKNRMKLRKEILNKYWGDTVEIKEDEIKLIITDEVQNIMNDRYILESDVKRVVIHSQKTMERFYNPKDKGYLARHRFGDVTFWVKYEEKEEGIIVKSVYSHRMEVLEEDI